MLFIDNLAPTNNAQSELDQREQESKDPIDDDRQTEGVGQGMQAIGERPDERIGQRWKPTIGFDYFGWSGPVVVDGPDAGA